MFKDKMIKFKDKLNSKNDGNNKKLIENLVVFVIILIVTIAIINYVWNGNKDNQSKNNTKILAETNIVNNTYSNNENDEYNDSNMSNKLESILSNIKGVGKVKVLITYSQSSQTIPMYSEDSTQKITQENDSSGGTRLVNETSSKKDVIYEENNGVKSPITQSVINPEIEGAVVTAQGASNADIKASIVQAVEAATGLATYKIQVFEMN